METFDIEFCEECEEQIMSQELTVFWRLSCFNWITKLSWIHFNHKSKDCLSYLRHLEKKGFFVTLDHHENIFAKPLGINIIGDDFWVCLDPDKHY